MSSRNTVSNPSPSQAMGLNNDPGHPSLPLWYAVFAPPFAWGAMELLGYYLSSLDCSALEFPGFRMIGAPGFEAAIFILWICMLMVAASGLLIGLKRFRMNDATAVAGREPGSSHLLAIWAIALGVIFILLVLASGIPNLVLNHCTS